VLAMCWIVGAIGLIARVVSTPKTETSLGADTISFLSAAVCIVVVPLWMPIQLALATRSLLVSLVTSCFAITRNAGNELGLAPISLLICRLEPIPAVRLIRCRRLSGIHDEQ